MSIDMCRDCGGQITSRDKWWGHVCAEPLQFPAGRPIPLAVRQSVDSDVARLVGTAPPACMVRPKLDREMAADQMSRTLRHGVDSMSEDTSAWVQSAQDAIFARAYGVEVEWSDEDKEYVATSPCYPSLSWLATTPTGARDGLLALIAEL